MDVYPELERYYEEERKKKEQSDRDVLAAFRKVTGWTDAEVLHYATSDNCACDPLSAWDQYSCDVARRLAGS